jgi:outer membrane protein assembly factor BamD (BamD/ComL family)
MNTLLSKVGEGYRWAVVGLLLGMLIACGEDPGQLFETARFEEQQNNRAHAQELYEQIIQQHPDSEYAEKARQRLEAWKTENPEGEKLK